MTAQSWAPRCAGGRGKRAWVFGVPGVSCAPGGSAGLPARLRGGSRGRRIRTCGTPAVQAAGAGEGLRITRAVPPHAVRSCVWSALARRRAGASVNGVGSKALEVFSRCVKRHFSQPSLSGCLWRSTCGLVTACCFGSLLWNVGTCEPRWDAALAGRASGFPAPFSQQLSSPGLCCPRASAWHKPSGPFSSCTVRHLAKG